MIKKQFLYKLVLIILALVLFTQSCATVNEGVFDKVYLKMTYPQDAVAYTILDSTNLVLNADMSYTVTIHTLVKIKNETFIQYLADSETTYNKKTEKFQLLLARTIKPNGKIININKKFISESKKYYEYPAYDDLVSVKFSYPNVEKEDFLELKYKIYCDNKYTKGYFDYAKVLSGYYPAKKRILNITYPSNIKLNVKLADRGFKVITKTAENDGWKEKSFLTLDTEGYQYEPSMPLYSDIGPQIVLSTYNKWEDVAAWYKELTKNSYESNDKLRTILKEYKKQAKNDKLSLAHRLFFYVTKKVRYVGVWFGEGGVKPRSAVTVLDQLYGDCKDKTTLLVTFLNLAGIKAWPVLVSSSNVAKYFADFPAMIFNHVITGMEINNKVYYVDPTPVMGAFNYLPKENQGRYALEMKDKNRFFTLPFESANKNGSSYKYSLDLDDSGGLRGELNITFKGEAASSIRSSLYGLKKQEAKEKVKRVLLSIIPGINIRGISFKRLKMILNPVEVKVKFLTEQYFERVDDLLIVPARLVLFRRPDLVSSKTRAFPLDFRSYWEHNAEFEYKYPANYYIRNKPQYTKIDNDFFAYKLNAKLNKKEHKLIIKENFRMKKIDVTSNEYLGFKRDYDILLQLEKKYIVFQKKKGF